MRDCAKYIKSIKDFVNGKSDSLNIVDYRIENDKRHQRNLLFTVLDDKILCEGNYEIIEEDYNRGKCAGNVIFKKILEWSADDFKRRLRGFVYDSEKFNDESYGSIEFDEDCLVGYVYGNLGIVPEVDLTHRLDMERTIIIIDKDDIDSDGIEEITKFVNKETSTLQFDLRDQRSKTGAEITIKKYSNNDILFEISYVYPTEELCCEVGIEEVNEDKEYRI